MCGIIGYAGHRAALPVVMEGLKRLEYRGYDSSGLAFVRRGGIETVRAEGKLKILEDKLFGRPDYTIPTTGLGHTRWATHGVPNEINAHPHVANGGGFVMVHNGIIENYRELKAELEAKGYVFASQTDTEILVNLIAEERKSAGSNLEGFARAVRRAKGAYALVLLCRDEPDTLYATRHSAPLILGLGVGENFFGSDVTAFLNYTREVVFLDEGEVARINPLSWRVYALADLTPVEKEVKEINWDMQAAQKDGYKHFMLKEIFEQPLVLRNSLVGRVSEARDAVLLPELDGREPPRRLRIVACGTSYNSGLWGAPLFEQWAGIPTVVEIASEFRYRKPLLDAGELVLLISQSGETADTLAALKVAREHGCKVLGLCNVTGSSLAREADMVLYTQAGPEISVASTKALCSQMAVLTVLAMYWGQRNKVLSRPDLARLLGQFAGIERILAACLPEMQREAQEFAQHAAKFRNIFFLGRGQSYALALEGALKLKELSYVHAEGYAAGEMKHGPIAMIDPDFLTVALAPHDEHFLKIGSNIEEVSARSGPVLVLTHSPKPGWEVKADQRWIIPSSESPFCGFLLLPMLQLLSYEAASYLGKDVDQPRNLAKSVTVE